MARDLLIERIILILHEASNNEENWWLNGGRSVGDNYVCAIPSLTKYSQAVEWIVRKEAHIKSKLGKSVILGYLSDIKLVLSALRMSLVRPFNMA